MFPIKNKILLDKLIAFVINCFMNGKNKDIYALILNFVFNLQLTKSGQNVRTT